ncbi:hypothetical protein HDR63_01135 [bacterium]|nr:hypothetical protein [bacterium]
MNTKYLIKTLIAGMMLAACGEFEKSYIVTDKADNKIVYHPIEDSTDLHVMSFDSLPESTGNFYPYIRVGDTIEGPHTYLDEVMAKPGFQCGFFPRSTISRLNGKYYNTVLKNAKRDREIAKRDSIIHSMQEKVK